MFIAQLGLIVSTLVSVSAGNSLLRLRTVKEQQLQSYVRQDMSLQATPTQTFFKTTSYFQPATSSVDNKIDAKCEYVLPVVSTIQVGKCVVTKVATTATGTASGYGSAYQYLYDTDTSTSTISKYTYVTSTTSGFTTCLASGLTGTSGSQIQACIGSTTPGTCTKSTIVANFDCATVGGTVVAPAAALTSVTALIDAFVFNSYNKVTYSGTCDNTATVTIANVLSVDSSENPLDISTCTNVDDDGNLVDDDSEDFSYSYRINGCSGSAVTITKYTANKCLGTATVATIPACDPFFGGNVKYICPVQTFSVTKDFVETGNTCTNLESASTYAVGTCFQTGQSTSYRYADVPAFTGTDTVTPVYTYSKLFFDNNQCGGEIEDEDDAADVTCNGGEIITVPVVAGSTPVYNTYNMMTYNSHDACLTPTDVSIITVISYPTLPTDCIANEEFNDDDDWDTYAYYKIVSMVGSKVTISQWVDEECTIAATVASATYDSCSLDTFAYTRFKGPAAVPVAAAASSSSDDKVCFAGSESVSLEDGSSKQISEVEIGDRILSADMDGTTGFSSVIALAHPKNDILTTFVHIETASADLKVTPDHLLLASADCTSMKLTAAAAVTVDSCIMTMNGPARVEATSEIVEAGIYSVVTEKELIVVNGIVASPFAVNHAVANKYYDIHRVLFALFPGALTSSVFKTIHFGISAFVGSL